MSTRNSKFRLASLMFLLLLLALGFGFTVGFHYAKHRIVVAGGSATGNALEVAKTPRDTLAQPSVELIGEKASFVAPGKDSTRIDSLQDSIQH